MRKTLLVLAFGFFSLSFAQFKITVEAPEYFPSKEVYVYALDGSKDILKKKELRKGNVWNIQVNKPYVGMMKLYFQDTNSSINFISENKDVSMKFSANGGKILDIDYLDDSNILMNQIQDMQQKKEYILPALYQIKEYYKINSDFGKSLDKEISRLSEPIGSTLDHPFINFYNTSYNRFLVKTAAQKPPTSQELTDFLVKSNDMLESSSLIRPILVAYLNSGPSTQVKEATDRLLAAINIETPRGQTILSELIEIFDLYGMTDLKQKYLADAQNLKCTINDRLATTISTNKSTEIGAKFADYKFFAPTNTKAKSIYEIKGDKKIIIFWSSTCSHCEKEIPDILQKYDKLKAMNVQIIGLSLDSEKDSYVNKVKDLPWINDSELKGWYSSYSEKYNIHATPTYYILDSANKILAKPDHSKDVLEYFKLQ